MPRALSIPGERTKEAACCPYPFAVVVSPSFVCSACVLRPYCLLQMTSSVLLYWYSGYCAGIVLCDASLHHGRLSPSAILAVALSPLHGDRHFACAQAKTQTPVLLFCVLPAFSQLMTQNHRDHQRTCRPLCACTLGLLRVRIAHAPPSSCNESEGAMPPPPRALHGYQTTARSKSLDALTRSSLPRPSSFPCLHFTPFVFRFRIDGCLRAFSSPPFPFSGLVAVAVVLQTRQLLRSTGVFERFPFCVLLSPLLPNHP